MRNPLLVPDETVGFSGQILRYFARTGVGDGAGKGLPSSRACIFLDLGTLSLQISTGFWTVRPTQDPPPAISKPQRSRPLTQLCNALPTSFGLAGLIGGRNGGLALTPKKRDTTSVNLSHNRCIAVLEGGQNEKETLDCFLLTMLACLG